MKIEENRFGLPYVLNGDKRKPTRRMVVFLIAFVILAIVISILVVYLIKNKVLMLSADGNYINTWAGSLASYWGAIIGGLISGLLAVLGVFYTIRYYKESDELKERAAIQPFLRVSVGGSDCNGNVGYSVGNKAENKSDEISINIAITNIGNGFANTLIFHSGNNFGGYEFNRVIIVGEQTYTFLVVDAKKLKEGISFGIQYIDSMRNEYMQEYIVKLNHGRTVIECGYPYFLEQR